MDFSPSSFTALWGVWLLFILGWQVVIVKDASLWHLRRWFGGGVVAAYVISFGLLAISSFDLWAGLIMTAATLYLTINAARLWMNRYHEQFLRQSYLPNVGLLYVVMGIVMLLSLGGAPMQVLLLHASIGCGVVVGAYLAFRLYKARQSYELPSQARTFKLAELPTVTVAIAARNETHALEEMLSLAIKSDYPKLEIIVLDDCSQDATAEVIRSFAHDGVRFVSGDTPATGWLGKNAAYSTLAEEASGELIIFASVDTHLASHSISYVVNTMLQQKAEMISVLPIRREADIVPTFFESLSNFWRLAMPAGPHRVPLVNQCWAIWAHSLRHAGGFAASKSSVFPEVYIARRIAEKRAYRMYFSSPELGITTRKHLSSQLETATRTFYPGLKRQPAYVFIATLLLTVLALLPYATLLYQLATWHVNSLGLFSAAAIAFFTAAHLQTLQKTSPRAWWLGLVNFPVVVMLDIALAHWSMLQFEFGEVNWKGRNVCYPVMQAIPMQHFTAQIERRERRQIRQVRMRARHR